MEHLRKYSFFLYLVLMVCKSVAQNSSSSSPVVKTKLGNIQGKILSFNDVDVEAYLSVPYAKPPLGNLRFKISEPIKAWNETIIADRNPPACPQYTPSPYPWYDDEPGHNEDCLYLNIFVSAVSTNEKRTVLFWLYGGGLFVGSNRLPVYDSRALAVIGDVIVVTINYRLGPLGFLYSGTDDAPGNMGISDMILALNWVKDNIDAFGGDPQSITIFGQSAGSIAVSLLTVSPMTEGLYKRTILMSGSAFSNPAGNQADLEMGQTLAKKVGCANDTVTLKENPKSVVQCLRGVEAKTLVYIVGEMNPYSSETFSPIYGDDIVGKNPQTALKNGKFHNTDILIGNVEDEGSFRLTSSHPDMFGFFGEKNTLVNKSYGEMLIRNTFSSVSNPDEAVQFYLGDVSDDDGFEIRKRVYTASGDFSLLCPTVYHAEEFAKRNNKVYYYLFSHRPSNTPWAPWMGVVHFEEVQFVFGQPTVSPYEYKPDEVDFTTRIIKLWTNFAKFGDPGEKWPMYSPDTQMLKVLNISDSPDGKGPHKKNCDFLKKYFGSAKDKKKPSNNGILGTILKGITNIFGK